MLLRPRLSAWTAWTGGAALIVSLILTLIGVVVIAAELNTLHADRLNVLQREDNIQRLDVLQRDLRMAETGQRGFLLIGDRRYLKPYEDALDRVPKDLADLRRTRLAGAADLPRLQELVDAKLTELALTIRLHRTSPEAALAVVRSNVGQGYMDEIDAAAGVLLAHEQARLRADTLALDKLAGGAAVAVGVTAILALLSGGLGIILILRNRRLGDLEKLNATLEVRVSERTERLTEANRELDAFAYTISHDLRAPLRAIHGYAEVISEDGGEALSDDLRTDLQKIAAAATRMNRLIDDILAYSKISKETMSVRPVGLDSLIGRSLVQLEADCANTTVEVARPLGDVVAQPAALQQAIENLLSNACKYVAPDTSPKIRVRSERRGPQLRLWIEDNGIGVAPEHYERIFKPFERLHGVETYPGTGIGLAIVQRVMERMGGSCGVEPSAEGGSAFWIELPEAEAPP